jgi:hypothetical protein
MDTDRPIQEGDIFVLEGFLPYLILAVEGRNVFVAIDGGLSRRWKWESPFFRVSGWKQEGWKLL